MRVGGCLCLCLCVRVLRSNGAPSHNLSAPLILRRGRAFLTSGRKHIVKPQLVTDTIFRLRTGRASGPSYSKISAASSLSVGVVLL